MHALLSGTYHSEYAEYRVLVSSDESEQKTFHGIEMSNSKIHSNSVEMSEIAKPNLW